MRVLFHIEYSGANYSGWQRQENAITVQEVFENALHKLTGGRVDAVSSGRTDAGVSAVAQPVHCDIDTLIPVDKLPFALNTLLPRDIRVKDAAEVAGDFHARYSAKRKTYIYKMYTGRHSSPIRNATHYHNTYPLDIELMRQAAKVMTGTYDAKCFQATGGNVVDTVRTVYDVGIEAFDDEIRFSVTGSGFLYNMVRIMVGTLLYVGCGKLTVENVSNIIESGDRKLAGITLPPEGLYLKCVEY